MTRHRFILRIEVGGGAATDIERVLTKVAEGLPGAQLSRNDYDVVGGASKMMRLRGRKKLVGGSK